MSAGPHDPEERPEDDEDDGVLQPADTLETDDLSDDPLDTGVIPPDKWSSGERYGTTLAESHENEPLDQKLAEEEPDVSDQEEDEAESAEEDGQGWSLEDGSLPDPRAGRLVADDEGSHATMEPEYLAYDVGVDGGAASAEEAAVHVVEEEDDEDWDEGNDGA
jgi:Family of unknown function (DUF5709)